LRKLTDYSYGLTGDRLRLYYKDFAKIPVQIPPIEEQRRIADVLDTVDRDIELLTQQADALKLQKKGLMQKLLTGQIRVKT
jgi:type I restriction enzyme S subunit